MASQNYSFDEKEILTVFFNAKQWCMDCYNSRVQPRREMMHLTSDIRREHALNNLQRVVYFASTYYALEAKNAVKRCIACTDSQGMPKGKRILEYLKEKGI